jgi:hypothetical protein
MKNNVYKKNVSHETPPVNFLYKNRVGYIFLWEGIK